jgi:hypothetical protein
VVVNYSLHDFLARYGGRAAEPLITTQLRTEWKRLAAAHTTPIHYLNRDPVWMRDLAFWQQLTLERLDSWTLAD